MAMVLPPAREHLQRVLDRLEEIEERLEAIRRSAEQMREGDDGGARPA